MFHNIVSAGLTVMSGLPHVSVSYLYCLFVCLLCVATYARTYDLCTCVYMCACAHV